MSHCVILIFLLQDAVVTPTHVYMYIYICVCVNRKRQTECKHCLLLLLCWFNHFDRDVYVIKFKGDNSTIHILDYRPTACIIVFSLIAGILCITHIHIIYRYT